MLFGLFVGVRNTIWSDSPAGEPFQRPSESEMDARDFTLLADGLSLLIARCSEDMLAGPLHEAVVVHARIASAHKQGSPARIPGDLLGHIALLIEPYADQVTCQAAKRCAARAAASS